MMFAYVAYGVRGAAPAALPRSFLGKMKMGDLPC